MSENEKQLQIYDIHLDGLRPCTQLDIDLLNLSRVTVVMVWRAKDECEDFETLWDALTALQLDLSARMKARMARETG